jgi:hypothetical protein
MYCVRPETMQTLGGISHLAWIDFQFCRFFGRERSAIACPFELPREFQKNDDQLRWAAGSLERYDLKALPTGGLARIHAASPLGSDHRFILFMS